MENVNKPIRLREEMLFQFIGRRNPVARTKNHRRRVKIIKTQVANGAGQFTEIRTTLTGIAGDNDPAGLFDRFDDKS